MASRLLIASLLSALLVYFAFPPYHAGVILLVGLVPVFWATERAKNWKQAALHAWLFAVTANVLVCWWIPLSVREFGRLPLVAGVGALLLLSAVEQLPWVIVLAARRWLRERDERLPLLWTPLAIMCLDSVWPRYFPSTFGAVFDSVPWLAQAADVAGVWGLTAVIAAANEAVLVFATKRPRREAVASLVLVALACAYGAWRSSVVKDWMSRPVSRVRVGLVQPNRNAMEEVRRSVDKAAMREHLLMNTLRVTELARAGEPDFVFWPETAYPDTFRNAGNSREARAATDALDAYARKTKLPILFGARDLSPEGAWYNTIHYLDGVSLQTYHKRLLLPFAEEVPFAGHFDWYDSFLHRSGAAFFAKGPGPAVLTVGKSLKLGPMICLEGLYPRYARDIARQGAQVLANATNDMWFGDTAEPELHARLTAFRSIETRRPLIRAATSGHSALVDIDGSFRLSTPLFVEQAPVVDVPVYPPLETPFTRFGDAILIACALYVMATLTIAARSTRRR